FRIHGAVEAEDRNSCFTERRADGFHFLGVVPDALPHSSLVLVLRTADDRGATRVTDSFVRRWAIVDVIDLAALRVGAGATSGKTADQHIHRSIKPDEAIAGVLACRDVRQEVVGLIAARNTA